MQCIHGGGDNSAHQNALTDSVQSDAHQPDIRTKTVLTAFCKHGQHTGNILHFTTGIRFQHCRASGICRYRTEKDGMPDADGEYAWLRHG